MTVSKNDMPIDRFAGLCDTNKIRLKGQHIHTTRTTKDVLTARPEALSDAVLDTGGLPRHGPKLLSPSAK